MPRALRIEYPGAIYHVMNRGDHREPIFRDDLDHTRFLATFAEACTKTDWQVHAFCLMHNGVSDHRVALQIAADAEWLHTKEENHGVRNEFVLRVRQHVSV